MDAAKYDQLWDGIIASPFRSVYIAEVHALADRVVHVADAVFTSAPKPTTPDDYLKVDHGLILDLVTLLVDAARIRTLIGYRSKASWQSTRAYEIQRRRADWLRAGVLKGVKLAKLFEPKVRNTLEHFDEYLDETALGYATRELPTPALAPIDIIVSRRRALQRFAVEQQIPNVYFIRVFIASERVFVNCGHEISVQALRTECRRIARRLAPFVPEPNKRPDERPSSMLVVTTGMFPP